MRFSFVFIILGFALYYPSLHYGFFMDDSFQILTNNLVHDLSSWYLNFTKSTVDHGGGNVGGIYYKPLMMIAYSFLWQINPGDTFSFRIFQLLLHCLNSFFIFLVFKNIFSKEKIYLAFLAGLLFLLHPINSEAVLFIADLQEPLYTFFGLIGLLILINSHRIGLASLFLLLSVLSKESGLLYLLISFSYILLFKKTYWKYFLYSAIGVGIVYFTLRFGLADLKTLHSDTMQISRADLLTRLMTVPKVLAHYIHLFFWPEGLSLTQDWVIQQFDFKNFFLPLIEVLAIVTAAGFYFYKRQDKIFLFWFLWFGFGWGLHSQLIPLDGTVSDRWFYFTMIGLIGMLASLLKNKIVLIGFIFLVPLTIRTHFRILNWQDPLTLFTHDLQVEPNSFYLNNNVGLEYFNKAQYAEAIPHFIKTIQNTVENSREWYAGLTNLGATYLYSHDPVTAESYLKIAIKSGDIKAYRSYAATLLDLGRKKEFFEFLEKQAFVQYPNDPALLRLKKAAL